ncbi:hypothetical protein PV326_000875, partial [Microctonus aethiopoides]
MDHHVASTIVDYFVAILQCQSQITSSHGSQEEELSGSPRRIKMIQLPQMRNDPVPQVKEKRNSEEKCPILEDFGFSKKNQCSEAICLPCNGVMNDSLQPFALNLD